MTTPVFICLVIAAILLIILLSVLVIRQILKKAYEKAVVDYQNKLLSQEMAEVQHIYLTMRGWRHDYHNHMQSIKAYLAKDNIEEAREYLNKLETDLDDIRLLFDTGNLNADAILNAKISLALENGIPCDYKAVIPKNLSVSDLKKNYAKLHVDFDLWKGESDAEPYIPGMVEDMKAKGFAHESNGALVVDVEEEGDKKTIPPCMILKSDGAALYDTTDLATLIWRMKDYDPDEVLYVVDSRQELHFIQCFRCAKKTGIVPENKKLTFLGFGTVNGEGGKPLKTRDGGVMRLEYLISDIEDAMFEKIRESSPDMDEAEAHDIAKTVSLAALKYGDLKNQPSKDYIFDMNKFISSEGDTGPYILYTIVRTKSILRKFAEAGGDIANVMPATPSGASDKALAERLCLFQSEVKSAYENLSPNILCAYIYALCNDFNHFYHDTKILSCPDEEKKKGYIADVILTRRVLEKSIDLLGFEAPERM